MSLFSMYVESAAVVLSGAACRWTATEIRARRLRSEVSRLQHDAVTGLPTRSVWESTACARLDSCPENTVIALVDLDSFKAINDNYGHRSGDIVLQVMGHRLNKIGVRDGVARIGGDEYGLILSNDISGLKSAIGSTSTLITLPGGRPIHVGFSIGHVTGSELSTRSLSEALETADKRLYEHKHKQNAQQVGTPNASLIRSPAETR